MRTRIFSLDEMERYVGRPDREEVSTNRAQLQAAAAFLREILPRALTQRQLECVRRGIGALTDALEALEMGQTYDALSVCIDEAVDALLELTGQRATTAVVDRVFHNFCVGK